MDNKNRLILVTVSFLAVIVQPNGEEYFRGIILQARMTGCNVNETRIVGTFTNTDRDLETKHCFGDIHVSRPASASSHLRDVGWLIVCFDGWFPLLNVGRS